jgi:hypothetical protein
MMTRSLITSFCIVPSPQISKFIHSVAETYHAISRISQLDMYPTVGITASTKQLMSTI